MSPTSGPRQNGPQSQTNGRPRRSMACSADRGENDIDVEGRVFSAGNWCRVEGDTATASGFEVLKVFLEFAPAVDPNPRPAGGESEPRDDGRAEPVNYSGRPDGTIVAPVFGGRKP